MLLNTKILNQESKNTPLIIIHGLFGMLDNWQTLGKKFSENRPVYLVDLRNHGKSFHSKEMSFEIMANDIINILNFYNLNNVILLGHSLGGKVAMKTATHYSNRIRKLIVADIAPKNYPPHHQIYFDAMKSIDFEKINNRQEVEKILNSKINNMPIVQFLLKNVYKKDNGKFDFRFNLEVLENKYNNLIVSYSEDQQYLGDTLFIKGEKSNYILDEDRYLINKYFPNSEIEEIKNVGHWLHAENPTVFFDIVNNFINR